MSAASPFDTASQSHAANTTPPSDAAPSSDARPRSSAGRDALPTLREEDFDFHDTIPAPPWLGDAVSGDVEAPEPAPPSTR